MLLEDPPTLSEAVGVLESFVPPTGGTRESSPMEQCLPGMSRGVPGGYPRGTWGGWGGRGKYPRGTKTFHFRIDTLHWDQIFMFSLFCHQNVIFVL